MTQKAKPTTAWACKGPDGLIVPGSTMYTRTDSIRVYIEPVHHTWKQLYSYGHRCVKVKITEI